MPPSIHHPVIFGEVLFDVFQNDKRVLGGAPFNVAWHLQGFGLIPLLVSRVGEDEDGNKVLNTMKSWRMETRVVQCDPDYATGAVQVTVNNDGIPHFNIPYNQAYDRVNGHQAISGLFNLSCNLLYHGTLALRHGISREALQKLMGILKLPVFLDINLRTPWWDKALVREILQTATWLKVNENELAIIEPEITNQNKETILENLCKRYNLSMVIVTLGDKGALLKMPEKPLLRETTPTVPIVDTVGAGDAFSAVLIYGLLQQWEPEIMLRRAVQFAADICQIRGATTLDKRLYLSVLSQWQSDN